MRRISKVKVLPDYHLELEFDDRVSGTVDLSEAVGKGVFAVWRDPLVFERVRIGSSGELVWGEQVDLCPDALYLGDVQETRRHFPCATQLVHPCLRSAVFSASSSRCFSTITTRHTLMRSMAVTLR